MFESKATKLYNRIDNVLKKDKSITNADNLNENVKIDIEKALNTYLEIKPSTSLIKIDTSNGEMVLKYSVQVKRIKEFIYY